MKSDRAVMASNSIVRGTDRRFCAHKQDSRMMSAPWRLVPLGATDHSQEGEGEVIRCCAPYIGTNYIVEKVM